MPDRIRFWLGRLREQLWLRPLAASLLSVGAALLAGGADRYGLEQVTPSITAASLESLLSIMASSMLVIAIFSVTSMVAAYASASTTATPRSFPLVLADDVSQNALSTFLGAFIFSIVALVGVHMARLQKALASLAHGGSAEVRAAARAHARLAVTRAERASMLPAELDVVRDLARFADE